MGKRVYANDLKEVIYIQGSVEPPQPMGSLMHTFEGDLCVIWTILMRRHAAADWRKIADRNNNTFATKGEVDSYLSAELTRKPVIDPGDMAAHFRSL